MPRLLLDARTVQRRRGGIGRMVEGLVHALGRLRPDVELVLLTGRRGAPLGRSAPRFREFRTDSGTIDPAFDAERLPWIVREVDPDAYHATAFVLPEARFSCRTVVTLHDACVRRRPELVRPGLGELLDRATAISLTVADRVATVSEFSRGELAAAYGVPSSRLEVVPNGVGEAFFEPPAEDAARRLELPPRFWLAVGAVEERKGLPEAISGHAIHSRRAGGEPWPLLVAGGRGGGERIDPEALAEAAGSSGLVRSLGYVSDPELRALYHLAAGVLYLSRYEGFGLPALEALAAGAPAIVAAGSALSEVVGDAALVVPPRDPAAVALALDRVRGEPELAGGLRAAGPARARGFPWDAAARRYLELYGFPSSEA